MGNSVPPGFGWVLLPRHGVRPLRFVGRLLLRVDDRFAADAAGACGWSEIDVFERSDGGVAACVRHAMLQAPGAQWCHAWSMQDPAALAAALLAHDPGAAWPLDEAQLTVQRTAWHTLVQAGFTRGAGALG
jgi:hypothetical protein